MASDNKARYYIFKFEQLVKDEYAQYVKQTEDGNKERGSTPAYLMARKTLHDGRCQTLWLIQEPYTSNAPWPEEGGENCKISFGSSEYPPAFDRFEGEGRRLPMRDFRLSSQWDHYCLFVVTFQKSLPSNLSPMAHQTWTLGLGSLARRSFASFCQIAFAHLSRPKQFARAHIKMVPSETTKKTELEVLKTLLVTTEDRKRNAVRYIAQPEASTPVYNLFGNYQHMQDLSLVKGEKTRELLRAELKQLDEHQMRAFLSLHQIPSRVCIVEGGPGGGKTKWSLLTLACAQAGEKKIRVLILANVNKTADRYACKMDSVYEELGMTEKKVVRMRQFRGEMRNSDATGIKVNGPWNAHESHGGERAAGGAAQDHDLVTRVESLSLDAAARRYSNHHQYEYDDDDEGVLLSMERLYKDTLADVDCIVTTPVTAWVHRDEIGHVDLVLFAEAAQATEPCSLTAIAGFNADVWFFVGDSKQVRPVVQGNEYVDDLKKDPLAALRPSMMERLFPKLPVRNFLYINHRSSGKVHFLPSRVFYHQSLESSSALEQVNADGLEYVNAWLNKLREKHAASPDVNSGTNHCHKWPLTRNVLIKHFANEDCDSEKKNWRQQHIDWVMPIVEDLMKDARIQGLSDRRTSVAILSPYSAATRHYQRKLRSLERKLAANGGCQHRTATASTIQKFQGSIADIVILDLVRGSPFTTDKHRLCPALTRAFFGMIIVSPTLGDHGFFSLCPDAGCVGPYADVDDTTAAGLDDASSVSKSKFGTPVEAEVRECTSTRENVDYSWLEKS